MEKFRKQIITRLIICMIFAVLTAAVYITIYALFIDEKPFSAGFSAGLCSGFITTLIIYAVRYGSAIKNPEKLKKLYIAATDERSRLIREKTASGSFTASVLVLGLATVIATFFSNTVACVLAAVIAVMAVIKMSFKFYYDRKY